MGTLHLVRHGQASFGADNYDALSDIGVVQSTLLGQWIAQTHQTVTRVVIGPAQRHRQTAHACLQAAGLHDMPMHVEQGFNEFNHEEILIRYEPQWADRAQFRQMLAASGNPKRTFQQLFSQAVARWTSGQFDADYSETWRAFQQRCCTALQALAETPGEAVWVFTSAGAISAAVQGTTGIPDDRIFDVNWTLLNTGVSQWLYQSERLSLSMLNTCGHLQSQRRQDLFTYR